MSSHDPGAPRWIFGAFLVSIAASVALVVFYFVGESVQVEGVLLALALGGMGFGVVGWATRLMHAPEETEPRDLLTSTAEERGMARAALVEEQFTRRRMLIGLLAGAGATLGAALAIPALSLGPRPGQSLFRTRWSEGARVVGADGEPLAPSDIPLEGVQTVFPEGFVGDADSQTLLIHLDPELLDLPQEQMEWVQEGVIAFSKICTHAGCPVGLYRAEAHQLLCPCHQSTFDVLRGAEPVFGPTARPLPQLPLDRDDDGFLIARSDYQVPVGPSFWDIYSSGDESTEGGG